MTPTLTLVRTASFLQSNKILRKYTWNHQNPFVRVYFVDNRLKKPHYTEKINLTIGYIFSVLKNGLRLGNALEYTFMTYGNSQIKSHSCWFLLETNVLNKERIVEEMGKFDNVKSLAKRYARMG